MNLQSGIRFLAERGLNLFAVLDNAALPAEVARQLAVTGVPLDDYRRLVLVGHGGRRMWEALRKKAIETPDPVDRFSTSLTSTFIRDYLGNEPVLWLYPNTAYLVPLQSLGEAAGWSFPCPLGSGISPIYGVWFAYRAAFLIDADLPLVHEAPAASPCDTCTTRPCITACPAGAVKPDAFDISSCARQRLSPESLCAHRCLARLACPICPEHRYTPSQIQYHYACSLETLRSWRDEQDNPSAIRCNTLQKPSPSS
jgi:hypothetical protein